MHMDTELQTDPALEEAQRVEDGRVLIVDDDKASLLLLERHLTLSGFEVLKASNGAEAMRTILSEGPPIVITDWVMPELDGMSLCRAVRSEEGMGFVYLIVLTGHSNEDKLVEAFEAGADDFLVKPCNRKELLARIRAGQRIVRLERDLAQRTREVHLHNAQMAIVNDRLNRMATTDELTGVLNRRAAMLRLHEDWATAVRAGQPFACVLLDIDHFKKFNDNYGHDVGDLVLRETAKMLQKTTRLGEAVARVGGEEYLVLCPLSTAGMAAKAAERLRTAIAGHLIQHGTQSLAVTISLGVAERVPAMETPDDLLKAADEALYVAKRAGRNRVHVAGTPLQAPDAEAAPTPPTAPTPNMEAPRPTCTILVVTGDAMAADRYKELALREGLTASIAADGPGALASIERRSPELLVVDASTPNFDALGFARKLKFDPSTKDIPIILCSTRSDGATIAAGFDAGIDDFIVKPWDPNELVLRLRAALRLRAMRRAIAWGNEFRGEQAASLEMLLDYSHGLASAQNLQEILDRTAQTAAFFTRCKRVVILLPDTDKRFMRIARCAGIDPKSVEKLSIPIGAGIAGRVFATQETFVANAPEEVPANRDPNAQILFEKPPLVSVAMTTAGLAVGVLHVTDRFGAEQFKPADLEYLGFIGHIAASAIHGLLSRQARDEARDSIVVALAKLAEYRDNDTGEHVERVTHSSVMLAETLRDRPAFADTITEEFIADMRRAAPLHDIGKVGIPDSILLKPGKLTQDEMDIMRGHCEIGANCLRSVMVRTPGAGFLRMAADIAECHHEWYNGGGYPVGLCGENIPIAARILALADVYDALRNRRPYKDAMTHEHAREIIVRSGGKQFDPAVVEAFLQREQDFRAINEPDAHGPPTGIDTSFLRNVR